MIKKAQNFGRVGLTKILLWLMVSFLLCLIPFSLSSQRDSKNSAFRQTDTATVNLKLRLAQLSINKGEFKVGKQFALQAQQSAKLTGYKNGLAQAILLESKILGHEGDYIQAINRIDEAMSIAMQTSDSLIMSLSFRAYGNMYLFMGNDAKSLEHYYKGLAIEEKLKPQSNLHWFYNNIGNVYAHQKNFKKALEYELKAAKIVEERNDKLALTRIYSNVAGIYQEFREIDSAVFYYNLSIKNAEEMGDKFDLANSLSNAATLYIDLKRYDMAKKYSDRSYTISVSEGYLDIQIPNLQTLGKIATIFKEYDTAEKYLSESLQLAKKINNRSLLLNSYDFMSTLLSEKGEYERSLSYYKLFSETKDVILNEENSKLITEMNTKYTTEKKEKEIELLKKNEDIQKLELAKKRNELERQRTVSIGIFVGFLLVMIVAALTYSRFRLKKKANEQLQRAFNLIEEKNTVIEKSNLMITDSITYAKRIQDAILPSSEDLSKSLPNEFFILYKPSQIVSGDFYWCSTQDNKTIFVVADCTGHGVPGAFMSMIGNTLLNEIVNEQKVSNTKKIAELLDEKIIQSLHQQKGTENYDGMDISICCIDKLTKEITFTGAHHSMYAYNGRLNKIKGDPYSIGGAQHQNTKTFSSQRIPYEDGLNLYFLTDGYCDQSGGEANKRFSSRKFEVLLEQIQDISMNLQKDRLEQTLEAWKGETKQRDDILVVGIKC